jgi:hypothetical protein
MKEPLNTPDQGGVRKRVRCAISEGEQRRERNIMLTAIVALIVGMLVMLAVCVAISVVICYLVYTLFNAVPPQHRQMEPMLVWLLLIPLFNVVWNFFVFPKLSKSYELALQAQGDTSAGDCNAALGMGYSVCCAVVFALSILRIHIPCVSSLIGVAALVLFIMYMVKMFGLKKRLASGPAA